MIYYKATRPDGTDFRTGTIRYEVGKLVEHPTSKKFGDTRDDDPATYLSVSTVPTDCTGMSWPCRLFAVEGVGRPRRAENLPNKRGFRAVQVTEELPATDALGPQGVEVAALIERCRTITYDEARQLNAAWDAAWDAAWRAARRAAWRAAWDAARRAAWDAALRAAGDAAWDAARRAARRAAWDAAGDAAWAAAGAFVTRDLIAPDQFDLLYGPWRSVIEAA